MAYAGYNMSNFSNATNLFQMYEAINIASDGLVVTLTMIALFIVLFIALLRSNNPIPESLFASGLACMLFAVAFTVIGLSSGLWIAAFVIVAAGAGAKMAMR